MLNLIKLYTIMHYAPTREMIGTTNDSTMDPISGQLSYGSVRSADWSARRASNRLAQKRFGPIKSLTFKTDRFKYISELLFIKRKMTKSFEERKPVGATPLCMLYK